MAQILETGGEQHFIDIREIDHTTPLNGDSPVFGKSPIKFGLAKETKANRRITETLECARDMGILRPTISIGPRGITHTMNGMGFVQVHIPEADRMYYVHTRVLTQDPRGNYQFTGAQQLRAVDKPRIKVISGPCLFSAPSVEAIDEEGNVHFLTDPSALEGIKHPLVGIKIDERLQPYEVDSILKLTGTMQALDTDRKKVTIGLNIPMVEYWFYALDAYQKGLISSPLLLDWFDKVKKRAAGIEQLMTNRAPKGAEVQKVNPLDFAAETVVRLVERGQKDIFGSIEFALQTVNPTWRKLIDLTKPPRFVDLGYLSYTAAHLITAQEADTLPVVIENPEEVKIIERTQKLIKDFAPGASVLGIFPHSNAMLKHEPNNGKRFLYFHRPNGVVSALKQVARTHQATETQPMNGQEIILYESSDRQ